MRLSIHESNSERSFESDVMEDILLAWIRAARNRQITLIVAGRLSGVHGWKRTYIPVAYQVIGSTIIFHFDGAERLTIFDAQDVVMGSNGELLVGEAAEVRFVWPSNKDPAKDCEEIIRKGDRFISFSRTDELYATSTNLMLFDGKFIVLR